MQNCELSMAVYELSIVSVNVGNRSQLEIGGKLVPTGFFKTPAAGPVQVRKEGLAGDFIGDPSRHGGQGQAVYLFSAEDAAWWSARLERTIDPGFFGENVTISRWWPDVRIGDHLQIGQLVLEISAPRIPCGKLAARVGDPHFLKTFVAAKRPGYYARVTTPGTISAGEAASVRPAAAHFPKAKDIFAVWHSKNRDKELLRQGLASPLAERARAAFAYWLEQE
jgi:MOSC domain-containing protein YiiM